MGIVNVTPDSFSDGGELADAATAAEQARSLVGEGADIIDVGGQSSRPGASPVSLDEELNRVVPIVERLAGERFPVSVDTGRAAVMAAATAAGATVINDISALRGDPDSIAVAAASGASVILMHMRGEPQTMQDGPVYGDVVVEVRQFLAGRVQACEKAGISKDRIVVDPGIGFGKTLEHNLALLRNIDALTGLGCPVMIGVSRKAFIGRLSGESDAKRRLAGSLAAALFGVGRGAAILRVHDVCETRQALDVWRALQE